MLEDKENQNEALTENTDSEIQESENSAIEEEEEKPSYFWFVFNSIIFGYNCYAIANNIYLNDGYFHIALGLVVNIAIIIFYPFQFKGLFPKLNSKIAYVLLFLIFIIGTGIGSSVVNNHLEESAKPVVTQILQENGFSNIECVDIKMGSKITENLYNATAILSNGEKMPITIFLKGEQIIVTVK